MVKRKTIRLKKLKLIFGMTGLETKKFIADNHGKRDILPEPNPDTEEGSLLGRMVSFLKTPEGGKQVSRNFCKLMPILDRI